MVFYLRRTTHQYRINRQSGGFLVKALTISENLLKLVLLSSSKKRTRKELRRENVSRMDRRRTDKDQGGRPY